MFAFVVLDINELNLPKTCTTEFPDPDDLLSFKLIICPDEVIFTLSTMLIYSRYLNKDVKNVYALICRDFIDLVDLCLALK